MTPVNIVSARAQVVVWGRASCTATWGLDPAWTSGDGLRDGRGRVRRRAAYSARQRRWTAVRPPTLRTELCGFFCRWRENGRTQPPPPHHGARIPFNFMGAINGGFGRVDGIPVIGLSSPRPGRALYVPLGAIYGYGSRKPAYPSRNAPHGEPGQSGSRGVLMVAALVSTVPPARSERQHGQQADPCGLH